MAWGLLWLLGCGCGASGSTNKTWNPDHTTIAPPSILRIGKDAGK